MINLQRIFGLLLTALLLQACNAGPDTPRPVAQKPQTMGSPQKPASSISTKDSEYIDLLVALSQRNPAMEAQQDIARGQRSVMGYYAGRAGLKIPGLTPQQQAGQRCSLRTLDGLGDVIYGQNHLKYRVALRRFAKAYNIAMMPACL